jgi:hypothetical protein
MSLTAKQRYLGTLFHAMVARVAPEPPSQEEESKQVEELDRLWWALTPAEQDQIEVQLATVPQASASLGLIDIEVCVGDSKPPRREEMPEAPKVHVIGGTGMTSNYEYYRSTAAFFSKHYFKPDPHLMWPRAGCVRTRYLLPWLMPLIGR